jgi:4-amino-4-deoxy-L-arabinose transferase-like glycosyltransferase
MKDLIKQRNILLLTAILLVAAFTRFYMLGSIAPSLNWDEAALGYNAYSLGIDGKDEFGKPLPISYLESFGDFKPVIYSYLDVIPVKVFGLNEFGVRFPSAVLGVLTVLLTYLIVKQIFPKKEKPAQIEFIALTSALVMALSPWHIMLSRGAYEANVSQFFIVLGMYLFLRAINKNMWFLLLSAASFAITFYTFNTARVFVPLMVFAMAIGFRKELWRNKKQVILGAIVGLVILLPTIPFLFSSQAKLRFDEVNIFSDSNVIEMSNKYVENDNNAVWSKVIHNRRVLYGIEFAKHYLDNLNPSFLFINGDGNPRFSTKDVGQLFIWDLPFLIAGLLFLFRKREGYYWLIPVWLVLGLIPAGTARETPHALRIETVLPTFQILVAYGFVNLMYMLKKYRRPIVFGLLIFLFINFFYFYRGLLTHYNREYSAEWQYPYKVLVSFVVDNKSKYEKVIVTEGLGRPYIYFLLYDKYDPAKFRGNADVEREALGFVHVNGFDKYRFVRNVGEEALEKGTLYINTPETIHSDAKVVKRFYFLDGKEALVAYEANQ